MHDSEVFVEMVEEAIVSSHTIMEVNENRRDFRDWQD